MSSGSNRNFIDYLDDTSQNEDETIFFPVPPSGYPDNWSVFYLGILTGIAGAALVPLSLWLSGSLIFAGYGMTALTLSGKSNRFTRSLCFGFGVSSIVGAAVLVGSIVFPKSTWSITMAVGEKNLIFLSVLTMPWFLMFARYMQLIFLPRTRT
jgi:hypothetical protein